MYDPLNLQGGGSTAIPAVPGVVQASSGQLGPAAQPILGPAAVQQPAPQVGGNNFYKYSDHPTVYNGSDSNPFSNTNDFFNAGGARDFSNVKVIQRQPVQQPAPRQQVQPQQPPQPQQQPQQNSGVSTNNGTLYGNAGFGGLTTDDFLKLLGSSTALTQDEKNKVRSDLNIPQFESSVFAQPSHTGQELYQGGYDSAGLGSVRDQIIALNKEINDSRQAKLDAQGNINENPFLSEASRVGRISRLNDKAEAQIANKVAQQGQLKDLYSQGINELNGLVTRHTNDFNTSQTVNTAKLNYLLQRAEQNTTTAQAAKVAAAAGTSLPDYLSGKATATGIQNKFGSDATGYHYYDPITKTFQTLTPPVGNYQYNPGSGDLYNQYNGQAPASSGAGSFPPGAQTPGSAAAVNNVSGLKDPATGKFKQFSTPDESLQATAADIQNKINGNTGTGLNGTSTLDQFVNTWINGPQNANSVLPGQGYTAKDVASYLGKLGVSGVTEKTPISSLNATQLATAVSHFETGFTPGNAGTSGSSMIQRTAALMVSGDMAPSQIAEKDPQYKQILLAAKQLDPNFSAQNAEINYSNKQKAMAEQSTTYRDLAKTQQTAIDHLSELEKLSQTVQRSDSPLLNSADLYRRGTVQGDSNVTSYLSAFGVVRGEIAKVLGGGTATDSSRNEASKILDENLGQGGLSSAITLIKTLMAEKIASATSQSNIPTVGQPASGSIDINALGQKYGF